MPSPQTCGEINRIFAIRTPSQGHKQQDDSGGARGGGNFFGGGVEPEGCIDPAPVFPEDPSPRHPRTTGGGAPEASAVLACGASGCFCSDGCSQAVLEKQKDLGLTEEELDLLHEAEEEMENLRTVDKVSAVQSCRHAQPC